MLWNYPTRVGLVKVEKRFAERRQTEVVIFFRRPFHFASRLDGRLQYVSQPFELRWVILYHDLSPSRRFNPWLYLRLWVKALVGDRVPALVLLLINEAFLLQQELSNISDAGIRSGNIFVSVPKRIVQHPCGPYLSSVRSDRSRFRPFVQGPRFCEPLVFRGLGVASRTRKISAPLSQNALGSAPALAAAF